MPLDKVNVAEAFSRFSEAWAPRIIGDVNDCQVKLARLRGAFEWHAHEAEDELFMVIEGRLRMHFRDRTLELGPGELVIVPRGTEHLPEAADGECQVLLFEPRTTVNTGNVRSARTREVLERLA